MPDIEGRGRGSGMEVPQRGRSRDRASSPPGRFAPTVDVSPSSAFLPVFSHMDNL